MPRYRGKRRRRRRPRSRKFRRRSRRMIKPLLGNKVSLKHRYWNQSSVDPGAGLAAVNVWSANGIFDPDITGGSEQVRGFDQISVLYDHYTVIGSKMTCRFYCESPVLIGIALRDSSVTSTSALEYMEDRNVHSALIGSTNGGGIRTITMKCPVAKFLGRPHLLSEDDCRGSLASNPQEQVYFHVFARSARGDSTDPAVVYLNVMIDYLTIWTEPKQPTAST